GIQGGHRAGDVDAAAAVVRDRHRPGEARAVVDDPAGVTGPLGDDPGGRAHGPHPVGDDVGQPHGLRGRLVPVDDVAVAGGSGVVDEGGPGDGDGLRREGLPLAHVGELPHGLLAHRHSSPRTTIVERLVATGASSASMISLRMVTIWCPPAARMASMCSTPRSSSPATIGRWWVKRCSPWTTREKSTPASGSLTKPASQRCPGMTAKVGGATRSEYPAARAAARSW